MHHKLRDAMAAQFRGRKVGGEGKVVETDGAYFGSYQKPGILKASRRDRRLAANRSGKRQSLVMVREREGTSLPMTFKSEGAALSWIRSRVLPGTLLNAD